MAICCSGDRLGPKLEALLGCALSTLEECGVPVCRSFIAVGNNPPWDECCVCPTGVGQLWVSVGPINPVNVAPGGGTIKCSNIWEADVWIGVLRCAQTQDDLGNPPSGDALIEESLAVLADRLAIVQAVRCCYGESNDPDDWTLGVWQPLGPMGGCVGGRQNVTIRFADPKCS
jgi:hypothetical protein